MQFIKRDLSSLVRIEYEMDEEDEAWLTQMNAGSNWPPLEMERFEELMDAFEQESFRVMHSARSAPVRAPPPHGLARSRISKSPNKPARAERTKFQKPPKPPMPSDDELLGLPLGLCRRYQQGRCHKGRSCKWKHEIWSRVQERWDAWQRQREAELQAERQAEARAAQAEAQAEARAEAEAAAEAAAAAAAAAAVAAAREGSTSRGPRRRRPTPQTAPWTHPGACRVLTAMAGPE